MICVYIIVRKVLVLSMFCTLQLPDQIYPTDCFWFSLRSKIFFSFFFLGPHSQHVEGPRWGFKLELQLLGYTTATAMLDLSRVWDVHCSSLQCQILDPLSKVRDQTCILVDTSWVCYCCVTTETPPPPFSVDIQYCVSLVYSNMLCIYFSFFDSFPL